MNPVGELVTGGWTARDWLGKNGQTVTRDVAESRAKVCVKCPQNRGELWWEKMLKDPIAVMMRRQLELKNKMELRVEDEEKLHVCGVCGCLTRLKIWTGLQHIKDHTTDEQMASFVPDCWIKKEMKI